VRPESINVLTTTLCATVALALQIGTNYANDYSDGVRGTDAARVGPFRLTASGLVAARDVRRASLGWFAVAAVSGLALSALTSWWLVVVGASAIAAGWLYTGGPRPYGYLGLGELFVFVYFGLVATVGTSIVQHGHVPWRSWFYAVALGSAACALLEANNLRDIDGDRVALKRTLAVRLGRRRASWLYGTLVAICVIAGSVGAGAASAWSILFAPLIAAIYVPAVRVAFSSREGRELIPLLAASACAQLLLGVVLVVGAWSIH
jgi:1,4-dihydroxy-2-naphthoate octaprenyltransferase